MMPDFVDIAHLFTSGRHTRGLIRMDLDEAACLWRHARECDDRILEILEVGRFRGGSTRLLSAAAPEARIVSIDLRPLDSPLAIDCMPNVEILVQDSLEPVLPAEGGWDLILIDGDHSYEGVRADTEAHFPNISAGGVIAFHDAVAGHHSAQRGVVRWVDEFARKEAVEEIDRAGSLRIFSV